jgi:tetratricopeptide (TPR) repeat protein
MVSVSSLVLLAFSMIGVSALAFGAALVPGLATVQTPVVPQVLPSNKQPVKSKQSKAGENSSNKQDSRIAINSYFARHIADYAATVGLTNGDAEDSLLSVSILLDPSYYLQRALLRQDMGRTKGAIGDFTHYIELHPNESMPYLHRGWLISDAGDQQAAFADFDKARELNPKDAQAWQGIASSYLRSGDAKGALQFDDYSLSLDPSDHWTWNNRACSYLVLGLYEKALADENKAIELSPNFGHHHFKRGLILQALGKTSEAEQEFDKAHQLGFDVDSQLASKHI